MSLTVGSLFSGIGGIEYGLEQVGFKVIWQVEISPFCQRILQKHWPEVPTFGDITTLDTAQLQRPDVLAGGFPCQDLSTAGQRAGLAGKHSGLWREFLRVIRDLRPRYIIVENVAALRYVTGSESEGQIQPAPMAQVLADLAAVGYDAEWTSLHAYEFGFPHYRERCFIVAYPNGSQRARLLDLIPIHPKPPRPGQIDKLGLNRYLLEWFESRVCEPAVFGVNPGLPRRLDRLRSLGNAVMPDMARVIGECILKDAQCHQ